MTSNRLELAAYSVRDLQQLYGVGKTKLYKEIAAGRLVARRFGSRTIFLADDVARWVGGWPVVGGDIKYGAKYGSNLTSFSK